MYISTKSEIQWAQKLLTEYEQTILKKILNNICIECSNGTNKNHGSQLLTPLKIIVNNTYQN